MQKLSHKPRWYLFGMARHKYIKHYRSLADMNNDGKMDKKEFSIAMHLIKKKLQGYELPKALPHSLKADPSPMMGSFGTMPAQPVAGMVGVTPGMGT